MTCNLQVLHGLYNKLLSLYSKLYPFLPFPVFNITMLQFFYTHFFSNELDRDLGFRWQSWAKSHFLVSWPDKLEDMLQSLQCVTCGRVCPFWLQITPILTHPGPPVIRSAYPFQLPAHWCCVLLTTLPVTLKEQLTNQHKNSIWPFSNSSGSR